jgi:hypothetical protein
VKMNNVIDNESARLAHTPQLLMVGGCAGGDPGVQSRQAGSIAVGKVYFAQMRR